MTDPTARMAGPRLVPRYADSYPEIEELAERQGWRPVAPGPRDDWTAGWEVGWEVGDGTTVRWYEDPDTGVEYAIVAGPGRAAAERAIRDGLRVLEPAGYATAVAEQPTADSRGRMLYAIAAASGPEFDEPAFAVLSAAMRDADPAVRRYAIIAASIPHWPQFRPLLDRLRTDDADPDVRQDAGAVLRDLG